MNISEDGLNIIKHFEKCKLCAYLDPVGIPTIGYGHIAGVRMGQVISQEQADILLVKDCARAERQVMKYDHIYHWSQNQFDALVSFAYNIGSIDQLTQDGTRSIAQISSMIPAYCKAGGKTLPGLVQRRDAEKKLFDGQCSQSPDISGIPEAEAVRSLQEALNLDGIRDTDGKQLNVDGILGDRTLSAIQKVLLKSGAMDLKTGKYKTGSSGVVVSWLQMRLNTVSGNAFIHLLPGGEGLKPDGYFGNDTRLAVGIFQESCGLDPDCIAGPATILALLRS